MQRAAHTQRAVWKLRYRNAHWNMAERKGQLKESAKIVQRVGDKSWGSVVMPASSV